MKFGYDGSYLVEDIQNFGNDLNLAYQFNGGRPSQLTESLRVFTQSDRVRTTALYAQDQWTYGRMTCRARFATTMPGATRRRKRSAPP